MLTFLVLALLVLIPLFYFYYGDEMETVVSEISTTEVSITFGANREQSEGVPILLNEGVATLSDSKLKVKNSIVQLLV